MEVATLRMMVVEASRESVPEMVEVTERIFSWVGVNISVDMSYLSKAETVSYYFPRGKRPEFSYLFLHEGNRNFV